MYQQLFLLQSQQPKIISVVLSLKLIESILKFKNIPVSTKISLYIMVFYAVIICLSFLAFLAVMLMCCCHKEKCRYLLYFNCFFLTIIALLGLLVTTVVSIWLPPMQWGCEYLTVSTEN